MAGRPDTKPGEPQVWDALNLDIVEGVVVDEPQKITDEQNKINSNYLRGNLMAALADESSGTMGEFEGKILKFHGSYAQDDRDLRDERVARGEEKSLLIHDPCALARRYCYS